MAGYKDAYEVFQDKTPVLTRELLDINESVSTLCRDLIDGMMNFCERGNLPPEAVWVNEIRYLEVEHYPVLEFGVSLKTEQLINCKRLPARALALRDGMKIVEKNGQTVLNFPALNKLRAEILLRCPNFFDHLIEFVCYLKSFCVVENYKYESLDISAVCPPILNQEEMVFSIPLRIVGELMDPEPKEFVQEENEFLEDLHELDFNAKKKAGNAPLSIIVPDSVYQKEVA